MMAGEQLQQLVKLRQLVMAQINAQNVYMATQTNREAQRAATQSEWSATGMRRTAVSPPQRASAEAERRGHKGKENHETLAWRPAVPARSGAERFAR